MALRYGISRRPALCAGLKKPARQEGALSCAHGENLDGLTFCPVCHSGSKRNARRELAGIYHEIPRYFCGAICPASAACRASFPAGSLTTVGLNPIATRAAFHALSVGAEITPQAAMALS
jgi:hypothetical protein